MKHYYLFFFLSAQLFLPLKALEVNVEDRLAFASFYREEQVLFKSDCSDEKYFTLKVSELSPDQRLFLTNAQGSLSSLLPDNVLRSLLCSRFIEKNSGLSARILAFWMTYKLMILRDYIDAPNTSPKEIVSAQRFLRTIGEDDSLTTTRLFEMTQGQVRELSTIISNIQNENAFIRAILDTPILANNFEQSLKKVPNKIVSPIGYINGNSTEYFEESSLKLHFEKKAHKLPLFYEIPMKLNLEGHPTFMRSQIMRKIKSTIDLSKDSLYFNVNSIAGNLGGTVLNYLLNSTIKKLELNSNYKVLIQHQFEIDSPLYLLMMSRIETNNGLKNAVKLIKELPASSNTLIADINSNRPFALSMTFPLSDLLLEKSKSMQAIFLRGPIVPALFFHLTSTLQKTEDEWEKIFFDRKRNYSSAGQDIITIHLQNPTKGFHELSSAQLVQIFSGNPLIAIGANSYSNKLTDALYAIKSLSKKTEAFLFFENDRDSLEIRPQNLAGLEQLRKIGIQFLTKNAKQQFTHLSLFSNQSLILDNSVVEKEAADWFVPIQLFKSALITKTTQDLRTSLKDSKALNYLNLHNLQYRDETGKNLDYKTALKKSLLHEKVKELVNHL